MINFITRSITKRPLAFLCLITALFLFVPTRFAPDNGDGYEKFQGKRVTVTGRVYKKEKVRQEKGTALALYLKSGAGTKHSGKDAGPPGGRLICYLSAGETEPELGSIVRLTGKLSTFENASNLGQFDARSYYQILKISYRLNQATILAKTTKYNSCAENLYRLRSFLSAKISEALPGKEAAVLQAMLLGEKSGMEKELKALYQRNGIAHILAISGLHISLLGMGLYRLLCKAGIPMKAAAVLAFGLMIFYGAMTGFSVSALRAIFMFSVRMLGVLAERTYDMLTATGLAAVFLLLGQPRYPEHSGFLFSFGCVLGIGLVLPVLAEGPAPVKGILSGAGMAAVTLPVYLWFYYQFPTYSIFLNFLVIPLMSLLMTAGLFLLACQILFPPLAVPFSFFVRGVLRIYEEGCAACEGLPGHLLTPGKPEGWQAAVCLFLLLSLLLMKRKLRPGARWGIVLLASAVLFFHPADGLKVVFLDVGQGDCIYIENENKSRYLIDGGSSSVSRVGKYRVIPFLKCQGAASLDIVFVTHPDEDHCNGIRELILEGKREGIEVKCLALPDIAEKCREENYRELAQAAENARIPVIYLSAGQRLERGRMELECLHPQAGGFYKEPNEYSVVLKLNYGSFSAMFTGDVEGKGEEQMTQALQKEGNSPDLTVLKAAHHGSGNSTGVEFLKSQNPLYTVISCGEKNPYGHPHRELLERLENQGGRVLITFETGAVSFRTDGRRVKVEKFLNRE